MLPVKTKFEDFEVLIPNLDGTIVAERVKIKIPVRWDEDLETWLLTEEAHRLIEDTKARHLGLLLPKQLKELRERNGCTQREMGELFQVGEKSWTRWESGKHRPSRSINLLIRAFYEGAVSMDYLRKMAGMPAGREKPTKGEWDDILRAAIGHISQPEVTPTVTVTTCGNREIVPRPPKPVGQYLKGQVLSKLSNPYSQGRPAKAIFSKDAVG